MATRTGNFPIGLRRAGVEWQKDLSRLAKWSKQAGFDVIDFTHRAAPEDYQLLKTEGPLDSARLAKRLRVTAMAVRQHLYALQEEKMVAAEERPVPFEGESLFRR